MRENSSSLSAPLLVVAVALVRGDGRVLMQQRPCDSMHGGLWEFPGGKVDPGEDPAIAAIREIDEELGLEIAPGALEPAGFAGGVTRSNKDTNANGNGADGGTDAGAGARGGAARARTRSIVICLYVVREWSGTPQPRVASAIEWTACEDIDTLDMPPLDYPLARQLCTFLKKDRK